MSPDMLEFLREDDEDLSDTDSEDSNVESDVKKCSDTNS